MIKYIESFAQNVPILGHLMSAVYSIRGDDETAQKTAIKATVGIVAPMVIVNPIADVINESERKKSPKKISPKYLRQNTHWMAKYGNKCITDLWIPGSNDSATYSINKSDDHIFGGNWNKTQRLNIREQLNAGIRFLDLRLITKSPIKKKKNLNLNLMEHKIYISNIHKGDILETVLFDIIEFIDKYCTEIVILRIERDNDYHKQSINDNFHFLPIFKKLIEICGDRLISAHNDGTNRKNKTLKELTHNGEKGRILLLLPSNQYIAMQNVEFYESYCGWTSISGDDKYICLYPSKWYQFAMEFWLNYERDFKYWDFIIFGGQCKVNKKFIQKYITGQFGGALKGITSYIMDEQFENIEDYASATNYQLFMFLKTKNFNKKIRKLIITHDYIHDDIIEMIISKNNKSVLDHKYQYLQYH